MFIEYSRLPGFENINVSFSRGMLRLAKFTNFATVEERLEYLKLLAGPNKCIQRISVDDFKKHPDEVNYIYIILLSILQMEECMSVLVQCPTVYWTRFVWPGKCAVKTFHFESQTLASAFNAVFTPYFAIMKKVLGKIKNNMLLFAEPRANMNNLLIKHFHDLIYDNIKDERVDETILYLRTNVNIPNVFVNNKKAVFHSNRVRVGNFVGQFLGFSFKRTVKWSKLDSVDSFEVTAVNYRISVNWEKTPRKVFLSLNCDTKNLRYIPKKKQNIKEKNSTTFKATKKPDTNENACSNESFSVEFPPTTSAKTEYLLKSNFSLQRIDEDNDPALQEFKLNSSLLLQEQTYSNKNILQREYSTSRGISSVNLCDRLLTPAEPKLSRNITPSLISLVHPAVISSSGSVSENVSSQSSAKPQCKMSELGKTNSRKKTNWISSNPAPDPYEEISMCPSLLDSNLKSVSELLSYRANIASPNCSFYPKQSTKSVIIRHRSDCMQKQNNLFKNYERFKDLLSRGTNKVQAGSRKSDVETYKNERENILQKHIILQNKTKKKIKWLKYDLHRVTAAFRAAKESWNGHRFEKPDH